MNINDLKQISDLFDQRLDEKLDQKLKPIRKSQDEHSKLLKSHSKLLKTLKKNQDVMLDMLDREQMKQREKIDRIEEHLYC